MEYQEYQILSSIDVVRQRPGMFIGDTYSPDHLVEEILDNALDEVLNNYANSIKLYINDSFWCADNGRGIAVYPMTLPDGTTEDSVVVLTTRLFSGSKFDNVDYQKLIGMHGVGLVAVNALSDWMVIRTRDREDRSIVHVYTFDRAQLVSKTIEKDDDTWSTVVGFRPSQHYFKSDQINIQKIIERLIFVRAIYNDLTASINDKEIPKVDLEQYVRERLGLSNNDTLYLLEYNNKNENQSIKVLLTYVESTDSTIIGNVNLRFCDGKFINLFQTALKKKISENLDKRFSDIPDKEFLNGLRAFIIVNVPEPKFDSQTKVRMVLDVKNTLIDPLENQIEWFVNQENIIKTIQINLEAKLHQKLVNGKKLSRLRKVNVDKLRDCKHIPGEVLYILEGDSADGTLKKIRDPETEAIFPLRGKVLNVESASIEKIKNNKEIRDLLEALGPSSARRYKKIKILSDADKDGYHITVLVLLVLIKFASDLIKNGNVSVIIPPLYGAEKGKEYIPIYDQNQIQQFRDKGYQITRFKGLGEMDAKQLEACIRSNFEYQVKWPDEDRIVEILIRIITDTEIKRQIMDNEKLTFDLILNEVLLNLEKH